MPPGLPTNRTEPGSGGLDIAWGDYAFVAASDGMYSG
jgi:hypothetical protein